LSGRDRAPLLLIVDDEPRILSALRRALRRESFEILAVETPAEALRVSAAHEVDLVLSDYKMPGMTGLQLLARLAERRPAVVRMLITGWTEAIPEQEMREVGVHAVVNKPWDVDSLRETLRQAVKEVSSRDP
jgi:response regulator RpfG family c-di-GMP phosphodiesterase